VAKRSVHRPEQVGESIRHLLADALVRDLRDPRIGRVTITSITVTPDLSRARVMVVPGGDEEDGAKALEGLRSAAGFLRRKLAGSLATRTVPELVFDIDRGAEHAARIDSILAAIRNGEEV